MEEEKLRHLFDYQDRESIKRTEQVMQEEELKSIMEKLTFYQRKYPSYFELLYSKNRTVEEEKDLQSWLHWQRRHIGLS